KGAEFRDAADWAKDLGIALRAFDIAPLVSAVQRPLKIPKKDRVSRGNLKARIRMILLYAIANTENRIVMGTGNQSELACGYFTKFGDGRAGFLPIGELHKTQVRQIAALLGVPQRTVARVTTAGM